MLQLGKLHLHLALVRACALREDVEDERGAIDYAATKLPLEIALLGRRQLVVEDDERSPRFGDRPGDLSHFARAGEQRRIGAMAPPLDDADHPQPGAQREQAQLAAALRVIGRTEVERHEHCTSRRAADGAIGARVPRARHYRGNIRSRRRGPG